MLVSPRFRNPFAHLFSSTRSEQYLARYVLREHASGRAVEDVLADAYVRNRSTREQRSRLLERPEVVAALGKQAVADLEQTLTRA
jgi:hypothetical protein